jgi:N-acetylmuramoyl-L-alanine amidase
MDHATYRYKRRPRYRLNLTRFISVLLVFLLALTAVYIILRNQNHAEEDPLENSSVTITPTALPEPTPPPVEIPEGKIMEPVLIVIDAGHGGRDPGTESPYREGLYEKDIVLSMAKRVERLLKERNINVKLTREGEDHFSDNNRKDLLTRATIANENNASLFVSIHVNAYDLKYKGAASVNGMEVYYQKNKKSIYENFDDQRFAQIMGEKVSEANAIKFNGVKSADFSVLRNTEMPAVLIETGYITNKGDHDRLASEDFHEKTAIGIANGLEIVLDEINAFEYDGGLYVFKEVGE